MARTVLFHSLVRLMRTAFLAERRQCSADDALGTIQESGSRSTPQSISRRQFLLGAGATGATVAMATMTGLPPRATAAKPSPSLLSDGSVYPNLLNVQLT
ncbi:MAG: twin-arginine translocation signal domain-containing protein [Nitrospira sp.]|nr:twin-arginine translocation signal domain-containing protein [Nitrospira sp.]